MDLFDYVIVGAGTAGSLLAYRLSEDGKNTVCVLEAGPPDRNPYIRIPAGFTKIIHDPSVTWEFHTEQSPTINGRQIRIPQDRTLGGSSAINGMVYNRGHSSDYDSWAQLGNRGWSYSDILPYYKRNERRIGSGDDEFRGRSGRLPVTTPRWDHPLLDALLESAVQIGIERNSDYNGREFGGAGLYQDAIYRGRRVSSAHAYLHPAMSRRSVSVRTGVQVTRILIENGRATGLRYVPYATREGIEPIEVKARKAVIVSAGTVNSPKLLQLSGIGPGALLRDHGIDVVRELKGVGENLHDHYGARMVSRVKNTDSINTRAKGLRLYWEVIKWLCGGQSVVGMGPATVHAFGKCDPAAEMPDFVLLCTPGSFKQGLTDLDDFPGVTIGAYPMRPESAGSVRIVSTDPRQAPAVQPNYLSSPTDQRLAIAAAKTARQLMMAPAMKQYFSSELVPGFQVQSDAEWLEFVRNNGTSSFHLTGTCKMGPAEDAGAVVDSRLRVHGMEALYVVDASIMPRPTSSNTCAPTMMIAEKASDMILAA